MDNTFIHVNPLWYYTQMAVPTVFAPELTNEEAMGKMLYKLNETIGQLNNIPGLIDKKINEAFDTSGIEDEIKNILSSMQLSVKNPPEGVPVAKGNGKANDTAAINGLINYANNLAIQIGIPMAVLIPTGNYAVTGVQLREGVSLIGEDMYNTVIKVMDYTNAPAIIGNIKNAVIGNFTLDGNSTNNAGSFNGAEITATGDLNIASLRLVDFNVGSTALSLTPNGVTQMSTIRADSGPIVINKGSDFFTIQDALLLNAKSTAFTNNTSFAQINLYGKDNVKELIINNGNSCFIKAFGGTVVDNGLGTHLVSDSDLKILADALSETITGTVDRTTETLTDTVTDARKVSSNSVTNIVTNAEIDQIGSRQTTVTGKDTLKAGSRDTIVSGAEIHQAGSLDATIDGALETTASSQTQTVTNIMDTNYGDLTEGVAGDKLVSVGNNSTETVVKSKTINADNLVLNGTKGTQVQGAKLNINTTDPLQYSKALKLNDHYNYIPMMDEEGNIYQILVFNGKDPTPEVPESHLPTYINVKELGAKGDGKTDDTDAFKAAAGFSGFIFVPAGTYLITSVTLLGGIKGIIGEMSTIKSSITSGNMLTFTAAANLAAVILDAAGAENAVSSPNGININQSIISGNLSGPINITACSVNNNSQLSCTDNSRILGSRINGNIALAAGVNAEITGNAISGSFVFVLSAGQKIGSLAITGNVFNPAITISDTNITSYRAAGNVGLADYPVVDVPEPPPAFDYNIPNNQPLTLNGTVTNKDVTINNTGANLLELRRGGDLIAQIPEDDSLFIIQHNVLLNGGVSLPQNQYITFRTPNNVPTVTWGVNSNGIFGLRSNWADILTLSLDQKSLTASVSLTAPNIPFAVANSTELASTKSLSIPLTYAFFTAPEAVSRFGIYQQNNNFNVRFYDVDGTGKGGFKFTLTPEGNLTIPGNLSAANFPSGSGGGIQQKAHLTNLTIGTSESGITLAQCGLTIAEANVGGILVSCTGALSSSGGAANISGVQLVADMETGTPTNVYSFTQTGPIFLDLRWRNFTGTGNNVFGLQGTSGGGAGKKVDLRIYYIPISS